MRDPAPADGDFAVLVVDDHRIFADVLAHRLTLEPGVSGASAAYSLEEARALVHRDRPDVVVLDYHVRDERGTALLPDLRAMPSPPEVVMLSATDEPTAVVEALRAGASGWVLKNDRVDVLVHAAREALAGRMYLDPATVRPVVGHLLDDARDARPPSFLDDLTGRQLDVLHCLVAGLTRAETAQRLYITANTVRTHVQALLRASGQHSTLALVAHARDLGIAGTQGTGGPGSSR